MKLYFVLLPVDSGSPIVSLTPLARIELGIFATADIPKGTKLPLFAKDDYKLWPLADAKKKPQMFWTRLLKYGVLDETGLHGPKDPNRMSIGWYIRHSNNPTAKTDKDYDYFATRKIRAGEEVTVDLHTLGDVRYPPRMRLKR